MLPCFALGSRGLSHRDKLQLDAKDVLWLDTKDAGILSMHKVFMFWQAAAMGASKFTHAAKVDDDSYLHVPNLLAELTLRASAEHLVLGGLAYSGYNPSIFRMCGWQWQRGHGAHRARKCRERGFSQPFPFPLGALQVLSRSLFSAVGTSPEVLAFAIAANASDDLRKRESNEDVALGYWLTRLASQRKLNVTFAGVNSRATNLGCFRNGGLYRNPQHDAIVIHRIKGAAGLVYVWRVLQGNEPFDAINCARASATELPRNSFIFQPSFLQRVRAGKAHVTFDPKTNRVAMIFGPAPNSTGGETGGRGRGSSGGGSSNGGSGSDARAITYPTSQTAALREHVSRGGRNIAHNGRAPVK